MSQHSTGIIAQLATSLSVHCAVGNMAEHFIVPLPTSQSFHRDVANILELKMSIALLGTDS
jgi:hypothetical protein